MSEYIIKSTSNGWGEYVGELVRCKDCKYWTQNQFGGKVGFCNKHRDIAIACDETDFCSWAERKEE